MKTFKHETLIISKEAWFFLNHYDRTSRGYRDCTNEWLERVWSSQLIRNNGANPETHPIADDEIRIDREYFHISWDKIKTVLTDNGFTYRDDGFIVNGFNI